MRASLAVFRRALGGVIGVASSATITRRASWPDFCSRRTVAAPMVSVSPTLRSTVIFDMESPIAVLFVVSVPEGLRNIQPYRGNEPATTHALTCRTDHSEPVHDLTGFSSHCAPSHTLTTDGVEGVAWSKYSPGMIKAASQPYRLPGVSINLAMANYPCAILPPPRTVPVDVVEHSISGNRHELL